MPNDQINGVGNTIVETSKESTTVLKESFVDFWKEIIQNAPNLIAAIIILVLGYVVARFVARAISLLCERIGLQRGAERSGLVQSMKQAGIERTVPQIMGMIVFWLLMCIFLMAGFKVMGLDAVSTAMEKVISFIPLLLVATLIVVVGLLIATLLRGVIATSADRMGLSYAQQLASAAYYGLILLTLLTVLRNLEIELELLNNLILIGAGAVGVGFALAFGFGGRDVVGGILAGYYVRQRMQPGDQVRFADMEGTVRDVGPVATIVETEEEGLIHRHSIPNTRMLNEAIR